MPVGYRAVLFMVLFSGIAVSQGQHPFRLADEVEVTRTGTVLDFPWTGGWNLPQPSAIDLNNDGWEDIVVFDKTGTTFSAFLYTGSGDEVSYRHAPEFESIFPARGDWALLRDYNQDGLPDVFSYTTAGFGVWKTARDPASGTPFFTLQNEQVKYLDGSSRTPLFTSRADLPGFADINGDGDLDVISFGTFGGFIRYFENLSVEEGWSPDSLLFSFVDGCWGQWFENSICTGGDLGVVCFGEPVEGFAERAHSGSTVLPLDTDRDGDMDLILGDAGCSNLVLLRNGGNSINALATGQDIHFPQLDVPADFATFLAAFSIDVDQDGHRDLLVAPNEDTEGRNARMLWYYRNSSADSLVPEFIQEDFLLDQTLDVGAESHVAVADLNADGLPDLLIGRLYRRDNSTDPESNGLTYFRNTGNSELASFEWVSDDFGGCSSLGRSGLSPALADLDADGDPDLLIGDSGGNLHFYRNEAAPGEEAVFVLVEMDFGSINFGVQANPSLYDLDRDGRPDLVLGERNGNLNYLRNISSGSIPAFLLETEFFGAVDTRRNGFSTGGSAPFLRLNHANQTELYVGSQSGYIYRYSQIDGNLLGTFVLEDSSWGKLWPGLKSTIALADVNGDESVDVLLGNVRGGLQWYTSKDVPPIGLNSYHQEGRWKLWPNPASERIHMRYLPQQSTGNPGTPSSGAGSAVTPVASPLPLLERWSVYRLDGAPCASGSFPSGFHAADFSIAVAEWPEGWYVLHWITDEGWSAHRFLIQHGGR